MDHNTAVIGGGMLVIALAIIACVYFLHQIFDYIHRRNGNELWDKHHDDVGSGLDADLLPHRPLHIKPNNPDHIDKLTIVSICTECGRTARSLEQSRLNPCPDCGGKVIDDDWIKETKSYRFYIAKWSDDRWVFTKDSADPCVAIDAYKDSNYCLGRDIL